MAVHQAAHGGHAEALRLLLEAPGAGIEAAVATSDAGLTPLDAATMTGAADCVRVLLAHGADSDAINARGSAPLHLAAAHGHATIVRQLLEAGASPKERQAMPTPLSCPL